MIRTIVTAAGLNLHGRLSLAVCVGMLAIAGALPAQAATPTTQRTKDQIDNELQQTSSAIQETLGGLPGLADTKRRTEMAPKAIPLVKTMLADFDELEAQDPLIKPQLVAPRQQFVSILLALSDKPTQDTISAEAANGSPAEKVHAQSTQLMSRWLVSGHDAEVQKPIADEVQKLDEANADSDPLTVFTFMLSRSAATPELRDRIQSLASAMKTHTAETLKVQIAAEKDQDAQMAAAEKKMKALEGMPLVVTGKTVDGKDFSSADFKGKVVLVDFWATWCGPCRAELPRVKKIYQENHAKGLEILGVSNDYDAAKLTEFTKQENMPWPQLLDAAAAADHQWNPTTLGYGINGIPTMFLIDKKGICRSVTAREDMETLIPKLLSE